MSLEVLPNKVDDQDALSENQHALLGYGMRQARFVTSFRICDDVLSTIMEAFRTKCPGEVVEILRVIEELLYEQQSCTLWF